MSYNGLHCILEIASVWVMYVKCNNNLEKESTFSILQSRARGQTRE